MSNFLRARWQHLAMLNYEVDSKILRPHLPEGVELDLYEDRCFVSLVGFMFLETRLMGIPIPGHRNFEEVNLRFYVKRQVKDEVRRGVVFIKELVPRFALAFVARLVYNENYVALPMSHSIDEEALRENKPASVRYSWNIGTDEEYLEVRTSDAPFLPEPGSHEQFIIEHYWGYSRQKNLRTLEYEVTHPPWQVYAADSSSYQCDVARLYGREFSPFLIGEPHSAFVAQGSEIEVKKGAPLQDTPD